MPLGLVAEILDAIDMVMAVGDYLRIVDAEVVDLTHPERCSLSSSLNIRCCSGHNLALDDRD